MMLLQQVVRSKMFKVAVVACLVAGFVIVTSCKSSNPPELPGKCSIQRRDTGVYDIVGPPQVSSHGTPLRKVLINADVAKVAVIGNAVFGYSEPYLAGGDIGTKGGYFYLDTKNHKAKEGMTFDEYSLFLSNKLGIKKPPKLRSWNRY